MKAPVSNQLIYQSSLFILVFIFAYAGLDKLFTHELYTIQLSHLPGMVNLYKPLSFILPIIELVVSLFLILPSMRLTGAFMAAILLLVFTGYLVIILRSTDTTCTCGGLFMYLSWPQHIALNCLLVSAASFIIVKDFKDHKKRIGPS